MHRENVARDEQNRVANLINLEINNVAQICEGNLIDLEEYDFGRNVDLWNNVGEYNLENNEKNNEENNENEAVQALLGSN